MAGNTRIVGPRKDAKGWQNVNPDGGTTNHRTQENAAAQARRELTAAGGGELIIQGENGRIRQKDTVGKPDPRGSKG